MTYNTFCHIEWSSTDLERTRRMLMGLFDWKFKKWSEEYYVFSTPKGIGGGIMRIEKVEPGTSPLVYVDVEDIEPYLKKAKKMGAAIAVPKTPIPGVGWFAHIQDKDGNIFGILQKGSPEPQ